MRLPARPVLIVDDDIDIREGLVDVLEARGFDVVTAANGLEALKVIRGLAEPPAVVLLDLMMPIMDGYGFLEHRKADPALKAIPVAIITAGHGVDRERLGNGPPIIPKPIDLTRLVSIIHGLRAAKRGPSA